MTPPQILIAVLLLIDFIGHAMSHLKKDRTGSDHLSTLVACFMRTGVMVSALYWGNFWN